MPGAAPVTLTRSTRARLGSTLKRLEEPQPGAYEGVLREIDLDKKTFLLRGTRPERIVRCSFTANLSELAKTALDRFVRVTGVAREPKGRRGAVELKVRELVILDQ
jgi:hypothetical protein